MICRFCHHQGLHYSYGCAHADCRCTAIPARAYQRPAALAKVLELRKPQSVRPGRAA